MDNTNILDERRVNDRRPYKIFISHSSKDKAFADCLVDLFEDMGIRGEERLFCSSTPGYWVKNGGLIREYILKQFREYSIIMIFVHSKNYYGSHISLNEMGASWVLGNEFQSFLVKGFEFSEMDAVIGKDYISIKVDAEDAKERLNDFRKRMEEVFGEKVDDSRWEKKRDEFLQKVNDLPASRPEDDNEEFQQKRNTLAINYLPFFRKVFDLLDIQYYPQWMNKWAVSGDQYISADMLDNLEDVKNQLCRVNCVKEFEEINSLIANLRLLIGDSLKVINQYIYRVPDSEACTIYKFYVHSPQDESEVKRYIEYGALIGDLSYEMTRLLNLLLDKVREYFPEFMSEYGIMSIIGVEPEHVKYMDKEKSAAPYPGLKKFVEETRFTRNCCLGETKDFNSLNLGIIA